MGDFSFDHPRLLYLLWVLPLLWGVYLWGFAQKHRAMARFATPDLHTALLPSLSLARQQVKGLLTLAAAAVLVLATAGPRWGTHYEDVALRGVDIMFVLDVSNSMLCEDVSPNRLERAKLEIRDMLEVSLGDRVGLLTLAGKSALACPLTADYGAFQLALESVNTRNALRGGTNIGDALRHAADGFTDDRKDHKAIILFSDGGETEHSYATQAARNIFHEKGIRVFTVGVGDPIRGARIPITTDGRRMYMVYQGEEVWTKLDPTLLKSVAAAAGGAYFSNIDRHVIYDRVCARVAPGDLKSIHRRSKIPRFHWVASIALALLTVEILMTDQRVITK
jgi:Ca-activated chloride channel family protein